MQFVKRDHGYQHCQEESKWFCYQVDKNFSVYILPDPVHEMKDQACDTAGKIPLDNNHNQYDDRYNKISADRITKIYPVQKFIHACQIRYAAKLSINALFQRAF